MKSIFAIIKSKIALFVFVGIILALMFVFTSCTDEKDESSDTGIEVSTDSETAAGITVSDDMPVVSSDSSSSASTYEEKSSETETTEKPSTTNSSTSNSNNPASSSSSKYFSYLTGLPVSKTVQKKRPVSIIINNLRAALPGVGVSHADIIYECIAEGGITRLMMVLTDYENVSVFGSVRSSREYFIDLAAAHDTIYVHAGGNPQDYTQFKERKTDRIDGVNMNFPNTFYRDAQRRRIMSLEHTLMTSGKGIVAGINQMNYRTALKDSYNGTFNFYEKITDIGGNNNTANYVCVPYSNSFKPEFTYNTEDKLYYRKEYGAAQIDGETGEQLKFQNVIVLFAEYAPYRETEIARKEGHLSCKLTGDGYGFYITGGKYKIIKWHKETRDSVLTLMNLDKSNLYLNPGKSFICVTSTAYNKSVVINSDIKK